MTLSEYIKNLQKIQERMGDKDPEVVASVRDFYATNHGCSAKMKIDAEASMHGGYNVNDEYLSINVDLQEDYDGKMPKIMFRK